MIGEMLDRVVGVFDPAKAARRIHARSVMNQQVRRAFDAARIDRTTSGWNTQNRSADLELLDSADTIRARARSLVQNNAYAIGILRAIVRNVVGCGIAPEARIDGNEPMNDLIETKFHRWQKTCDITGRLSFYEMQSLILSEVIEAGEILVHFVKTPNDRSREIPFALELVEADRLATDWFPRGQNKETGNEVRRGVEVDANGRPVAYWLYESHPTDLHNFRQIAQRYPANEFLHIFKQKRVGQTRGVSDFAPVVRWLKDLHYYVENEMQSSAIASCFTVAITTMGGQADGGILDANDAASSDSHGNKFEYIQPGLVPRLMPGEGVEVINPTRGHADSAAWIELMLRSMAVGTGLSYERLSRDYSKTNYSSNRASDLEDRREFRPMQEFLITHLCEPVYERFLAEAAMANLEGMPSVIDLAMDFETWSKHVQQPPGWEWVDPVKEQKASADAIASNLSTLSDEAGKRGKDWRDLLNQRAKEEAFKKSLGLTTTAQETGVASGETEETEDENMEVVSNGTP
jgi:lambda family phage portal protein